LISSYYFGSSIPWGHISKRIVFQMSIHSGVGLHSFKA
jgi:hypothetical protein